MTGKDRRGNDRTGWDRTRQDSAGYDRSVKTVKHISTKLSAFAREVGQTDKHRQTERQT